MNFAPIVLFVYNRPWHTQQTIEALLKNKYAAESELIIYSDGYKQIKDKDEVRKVRSYINTIVGFKKVTIHESPYNLGLAQSVIKGVTETVNKFERVIVLEDDLKTSPYFLTYMNEALDAYSSMDNVYSVNGYMFPIESALEECVLLPFTSTWGWATWKDKWQAFDYVMPNKETIQNSTFLKNRFNLADYNYSMMLNYGNNSWGIRWYYSVFIRNGLGIFPSKSLVDNIGFDGSGTNCNNKSDKSVNIFDKKILVKKKLSLDLEIYGKIANLFTIINNKKNRNGIFTRFKLIFKRLW